jgi:uracil-DNA glycosylase family 4
MNITKKMIPCDCKNTGCKEIASCCFTATEVVRRDGGNCEDGNYGDIGLMFVGQGAGRDEDINMNPRNTLRQPFVGKAGAYLRNMIKFLWDDGLTFNVAISNTVRFHPLDAAGKDRAPTQSELNDCIGLLDRDIDMIKPKTLVALGMSTSNALIPETTGAVMAKITGQRYLYRGIKTVPLYHPSFLTRNYGKFSADQRGNYHLRCVEVLKSLALEASAG